VAGSFDRARPDRRVHERSTSCRQPWSNWSAGASRWCVRFAWWAPLLLVGLERDSLAAQGSGLAGPQHAEVRSPAARDTPTAGGRAGAARNCGCSAWRTGPCRRSRIDGGRLFECSTTPPGCGAADDLDLLIVAAARGVFWASDPPRSTGGSSWIGWWSSPRCDRRQHDRVRRSQLVLDGAAHRLSQYSG